MSCRALHWSVLGFATLWFGVLVPVHNRGEISMGGSAGRCVSCKPAAARPHCHRAAARDGPEHRRHECPAPARGGDCAVCHFVAGLDAPPPVTTIVTRLGFAGAIDLPPPAELPAARITLHYHSRAPPAA